MRYLGSTASAVAVAVIMAAAPTLAADRFTPQASGAQGHRSPALQQGRHGDPVESQGHTRFGGPRLDQRPDPNYQNPYRPMFSPNAVNPGEEHPYFKTPKAGFGYPTGNTGVYQGNGIYIIPR